MNAEPLVMFILVDHRSNWKGYWDPTLNQAVMFSHASNAVSIYRPKPSTNYMVTITSNKDHTPYYLFQEVLDPTLIDLLEKK